MSIGLRKGIRVFNIEVRVLRQTILSFSEEEPIIWGRLSSRNIVENCVLDPETLALLIYAEHIVDSEWSRWATLVSNWKRAAGNRSWWTNAIIFLNVVI